MARSVYLETFGCQMNTLDSELVLGQLRAQGYQAVDDCQQADVILYNTCSVRDHAEQKVRSRLGELRFLKRKRPGMIIGVLGCMAEREGDHLLHKYPHVDVLCGPAELDKLPLLLHNAAISGRQVALMGRGVRRSGTHQAAEDNLEMLDLSRSMSLGQSPAQAYVRVTRGCDKFCSYCIVPFTRGPEVHRPPQNIIDDVKRLVAAGAREVTLLGQTVNHYAYQHGDGRTTSFADLLYQIHESATDLARLRFVTSFPRDFTIQTLQVMRDCQRICRYLHLPAQSGSNRILGLMNRGYTVEQYRDLIDQARSSMSDVSVASDFIVGFPSETDDDHAASLELIRYCGFKNSFIFKYSPRPGTAAVRRLKDDVPDVVKRRRNNQMLAVQAEVSAQLNQAMVGQSVRVLVEGSSKLAQKAGSQSLVQLGLAGHGQAAPLATAGSSQLVGRTGGDQIVVFDGPSALAGQIVNVRIIEARQMTLVGELQA